tara:strand:- start:306 stop:935 length:630 start_codon:yes stop_codon:yes gene_type:complete
MSSIEWKISKDLVNYQDALTTMENRVNMIHLGSARELVWMLEHPPIFTIGTSAKINDLVHNYEFPVFKSGRGGRFTYHGPGQLVAYTMLDLNKRGKDLKKFIQNLEEWIILALAEFGIQGKRKRGHIGVWTKDKKNEEKKIAAIGIRVRKWITFHGLSINVNPKLSHYDNIEPCGLTSDKITSFYKLGINVSTKSVAKEMKKKFIYNLK